MVSVDDDNFFSFRNSPLCPTFHWFDLKFRSRQTEVSDMKINDTRSSKSVHILISCVKGSDGA